MLVVRQVRDTRLNLLSMSEGLLQVPVQTDLQGHIALPDFPPLSGIRTAQIRFSHSIYDTPATSHIVFGAWAEA